MPSRASRADLLHGLREHVGAGVPQHRQTLVGVDGHGLDDVAVGQRVRQVAQLAVHAGDDDRRVAASRSPAVVPASTSRAAPATSTFNGSGMDTPGEQGSTPRCYRAPAPARPPVTTGMIVRSRAPARRHGPRVQQTGGHAGTPDDRGGVPARRVQRTRRVDDSPSRHRHVVTFGVVTFGIATGIVIAGRARGGGTVPVLHAGGHRRRPAAPAAVAAGPRRRRPDRPPADGLRTDAGRDRSPGPGGGPGRLPPGDAAGGPRRPVLRLPAVRRAAADRAGAGRDRLRRMQHGKQPHLRRRRGRHPADPGRAGLRGHRARRLGAHGGGVAPDHDRHGERRPGRAAVVHLRLQRDRLSRRRPLAVTG